MARSVNEAVSQSQEEKAMPTHVDDGSKVVQDDITTIAHDDGQLDDKQDAQLKQQLASSKQGGWTPVTDEEKRLNRRLNMKFDLVILPIVAVAYLFNQLDRTNLGNAEAGGFSSDLGIRPETVNNASTLFFATYIPFQPLAASIGRRVGHPRYMAGTLITWGILTICHAFVKTDAQLIAVRILMGLAECGFYPLVLSYLSEFYPRYECGLRFALFYGFFSIAGAFGGLLAFGLLQVKGSMYGWQYLFIIEGVIPVALGLIIPFWLSTGIDNAWYLKPEEKEFAKRRMHVDLGGSPADRKITKRDWMEAVKDWRVWTTMLSNTMASLASQGFTIFFPMVVKGLGYESGARANLMTVPPYVAGALGVWFMAWSSDHFRERSIHVVSSMFVVILGLILAIVIPLGNIPGRYAGLTVLMFAGFMQSPIVVAWLSGNTPEGGKRAVVLGISGYANLAGIIGTQLFRPQYGPTYHYPLSVTTGLMSVGLVGFAGTAVGLRLVNRWRAKKIASMTPEEIEEERTSDVRVGDKKYTFVYGL